MPKLQIPMIFRDSENIYLEFPAMKDGPIGWVRKFPMAEGGLALLKLKDIPTIEQHPGYTANASRLLAKQEEKVHLSGHVARVSHPGRPPTKEAAATKRAKKRYAKEESKEFLQKLGLTRKQP